MYKKYWEFMFIQPRTNVDDVNNFIYPNTSLYTYIIQLYLLISVPIFRFFKKCYTLLKSKR